MRREPSSSLRGRWLAAVTAVLLAACGPTGAGPDDNDGGADGPGDGAGSDGSVTLTVSAVSPAQGPLEGHTPVVVSGRGFVNGATVTFGSQPGASPAFLSTFQLKVETPAADAPGKVAVTVRNPDGTSATLPAGFEYRVPSPAAVDWCVIQWPTSTTARPGEATESIFGRVWEQGCTDGANRCQAIRGELGYGSPSGNPASTPTAFTWVPAAYNDAHTDDDNDEYMAALTVATEGDYAYAYRFSMDDGATWVYCDTDGSDGFQAAEMGQLTVGAQVVSIGWCGLQWPTATTAAPGTATELIYGRVWAPGCTDGAARCGDLTAELGYGPPGATPDTNPAAYRWISATYNSAHTGDDNDEYQAAITEPKTGLYRYAYRFSADRGSTWTYCDLDGSLNGVQADQLGRLTVGAAAVGWCQLWYPLSTTTTPGVACEPIYGQVFVEGCTEPDGQCASVTAQLGWGDPTVDPSVAPASYTWLDAAYNAGHTGDNNDEYQAAITPTSAGSYAYVYRFSTDWGATWTYCDRNGDDEFQTAQMGQLEVTGPAKSIDWCNVQSPTEVSVAAGATTAPIYGQVYSGGCTDGAAQCGGITAELGWGAQSADPSQSPQSYTWIAATYNAGHTSDDNDEYAATITPTQAGTFAYVFRFSGDGGATWKYCDTTGDPFAAADAGVLTVTP